MRGFFLSYLIYSACLKRSRFQTHRYYEFDDTFIPHPW